MQMLRLRLGRSDLDRFFRAAFPAAVMQHAERVSLGWRPEIPATWPVSVKRLVMKCWAAEPGERPTFTSILAMIDAIVMTGDVQWYMRKYETAGCCSVM